MSRMARVRKGDTSAERQPLILIDNPTLGGITAAKSPSHSPVLDSARVPKRTPIVDMKPVGWLAVGRRD